jgi:hypothetical protein
VRNSSTSLLLTASIALCGCSPGTVSNDDGVSRHAAEQTVFDFLADVHGGRDAAACARLPAQQRTGLARRSGQRGGEVSCEAALRTLREFAPLRAGGALDVTHEIGFRGALPHRARQAVDVVTIRGRAFGAIGLRRSGNSWRIAVVCDCG